MGTKSANRIHRSASKFRVRPNWKMSLVSALHVHCSVPRRRSSYCRSRIWWQMADAAGKRGRPPTAATALPSIHSNPSSSSCCCFPCSPLCGLRPTPIASSASATAAVEKETETTRTAAVARAGSPPLPPPPVSAPFSTSAAEGGGGRGDLWWLGNFWKCCCRRMEETPKPRWNGKRRMMGKGETRGFVPRLGWMEGRGEATSPREKREGGRRRARGRQPTGRGRGRIPAAATSAPPPPSFFPAAASTSFSAAAALSPRLLPPPPSALSERDPPAAAAQGGGGDDATKEPRGHHEKLTSPIA